MEIKELRELKGKSNELLMIEINKLALEKQFNVGTENNTRLRKALAVTGKGGLLGVTLLCHKVHVKHSEWLFKSMFNRFIKKENTVNSGADEFNKNNEFQIEKLTEHEIADKFVRAFTLIHGVSVLDHKTALAECVKMKKAFLDVIKDTKGISVIAVIECEVISLKKMRELKDSGSSDDEHRKLNGCEELAKDIETHIDLLVSPDQSLFLIHLHGTLFAKKEIQFDTFRVNLLKNNQWSKTGFQVEIKKLSKFWNEKNKSVQANLKHWAKYITKGGNDWNNGKAYLRYKVGFNGSSEEDWITKNKRTNEFIKQEHIEEGITDSLSMTVTEITELTLLIDALMGLQRDRKGYLLITR